MRVSPPPQVELSLRTRTPNLKLDSSPDAGLGLFPRMSEKAPDSVPGVRLLPDVRVILSLDQETLECPSELLYDACFNIVAVRRRAP